MPVRYEMAAMSSRPSSVCSTMASPFGSRSRRTQLASELWSALPTAPFFGQHGDAGTRQIIDDCASIDQRG